jgi:plastocyanin
MRQQSQRNMNLHYYVVFSIGIMLLLSSHTVFADNSNISWKITIKKNGTDSNSTIFWPPELQVRQGDTLMWINNDTTSHAITSGMPDHLNYSGKIFDSGVLNPGQSYSFKIPHDIWSAYYYFCKIHPWMTGKIDVGIAYLGKSPAFTITTDKESYSNNETMQISGVVNDTSQIMPLRIQIFDSQRNMVFSDSTNLLSDHSFRYQLKTSNSIFKTTGYYKIKAFYEFPATVTDVNFFFNNLSQNTAYTSLSSFKIPYWVKNNAKWWSQNQISDEDFIKGIQFLIMPEDLKSNLLSQASTNVIPPWIKNDASLWSSGAISDGEFISSMQYLIDHSIIKA